MLAVFPQPLFEYFDGRDEVPAEGHQHVNIVPIAVATKTVDMTNMMHINPTDIDSNLVIR